VTTITTFTVVRLYREKTTASPVSDSDGCQQDTG